MKFLSENSALARLDEAKTDYRNKIRKYEAKAEKCSTCLTKGACCLDAHFVNVRITRLEAAAMQKVLSRLPESKQAEIAERISAAIEKYKLDEAGENFQRTFACPLFEKEAGCLVHAVKPVPCIQHACYERREDLPPDELQNKVEQQIERLNRKTYGGSFSYLPLPLQLQK